MISGVEGGRYHTVFVLIPPYSLQCTARHPVRESLSHNIPSISINLDLLITNHSSARYIPLLHHTFTSTLDFTLLYLYLNHQPTQSQWYVPFTPLLSHTLLIANIQQPPKSSVASKAPSSQAAKAPAAASKAPAKVSLLHFLHVIYCT